MRQNRTIVVVVCAVLVIGILYFLNLSDEGPRYSWFENYRASNDQPYGLSFIRKMLESYRPGHQVIVNDKGPVSRVLKNIKDPSRADYVFIGHHLYMDEESAASLARFVEAGGNAFIASVDPPEQILNAVYFKECGVPVEYQYNFLPEVTMNFFHEDLRTKNGEKYSYMFITESTPYSWDYFAKKIFCDSTRSIAPLGYMNNDLVNFVRIPVGSGALYAHSNPIAFTNYFLTDAGKVAYASSVFSHLDGEDMIWDEFSKIPAYGNNHGFDSPLYYVMQQPSLKYAWWMMVITVLLYVAFASKRKQRPVPVREPKVNTSLEFVKMIARLHFKNGNHLDMAHKKMKYFLYFIRSKYGIHAERFGDEQMRRLAEKSRVSLSDVHVIFSRYYLIEEKFRTNIEATRLVDLYDSIDNFYRQSK